MERLSEAHERILYEAIDCEDKLQEVMIQIARRHGAGAIDPRLEGAQQIAIDFQNMAYDALGILNTPDDTPDA